MASLSIAKIKGRNPFALILGQILFLARLLLIGIEIFLAVTLHSIWRALRLNSPWPRIFLRTLSWTCGIVATTRGMRLQSNVFYAANHHSWIDVPVVAGLTGCTFVANDGIESWPFIGWLCTLNNTIFVSRENKLSVAEQINELRTALATDQPVTVFPEGTTHNGDGLLPFKPSLFAALIPPPPGMMVQPVFLTYGSHTARIAWVGEESAPGNFWRLLSYVRPVAARLHFLEPINPLDFADRKMLSAAVRDRIRIAQQASSDAF